MQVSFTLQNRLGCYDIVYNDVITPDTRSETDKRKELEELLCPSDSAPLSQPMYMLCDNDNCSFTWTGKHHITQVGLLFTGRRLFNELMITAFYSDGSPVIVWK